MALTQLSTDHMPPAERAGHWSRVIAETYFPLQLAYRDAANFQGRLERRSLGPVSLSRLQTEPAQYERRPSDISRSSDEEYLITIPRRSPVEFRQIGREVRCDPGGFILERGDEPYRFSYNATNDLCVLKIAKPYLAERLRNPDRFCALVLDGRTGVGGLFTSMARQVQGGVSNEGRTGEILGRQMIELLALALDSGAETDGSVPTVVRLAHLQRAQRFVQNNLSNPLLSPEIVADACGISKRYLHELFSETNATVSQHIREQRLIAARNLLQLPGNLPMADIAYRYGFSDQAQFSRLFRAMFGQSPSGYRSRLNDG